MQEEKEVLTPESPPSGLAKSVFYRHSLPISQQISKLDIVPSHQQQKQPVCRISSKAFVEKQKITRHAVHSFINKIKQRSYKISQNQDAGPSLAEGLTEQFINEITPAELKTPRNKISFASLAHLSKTDKKKNLASEQTPSKLSLKPNNNNNNTSRGLKLTENVRKSSVNLREKRELSATPLADSSNTRAEKVVVPAIRIGKLNGNAFGYPINAQQPLALTHRLVLSPTIRT